MTTRAIVISDEMLVVEADRPIALADRVGRVERLILEGALRLHRGNRTVTARALGIHRNTLLNKIRRYGL